jgi:hypothetical protein
LLELFGHLHRKEQGDFANDNVFFYHRNAAAGPIFPPNSIQTFTTFALTHELESYQGRATLLRFISLIYGQLALGGRWINMDVAGPEDGDAIVYMRLNQADGRNDDYEADFGKGDRESFRQYLQGLSTFARFLRFQRDFRRGEGYRLESETGVIGGETYVRLRLRDACEFMSKKDYLDNWHSEMHETFCFWDVLQWRQALERAGFAVHPDSHAFANPWIVENRYRGKVELFRKIDSSLQPMDYPVTNVLLIAEKQ